MLTVELLGVDEALKIIDNIHSSGYHPIMYVYVDGKMILDNIEP
jgi:N-acetyl-beta-hexosaminidase